MVLNSVGNILLRLFALMFIKNMGYNFLFSCSLPGSSVHGILQARILEWVAIPFSRESSWSRDWTWVSHIAGRFFYHLSLKRRPFTFTFFFRLRIFASIFIKDTCVCVLVAQWCPILWDAVAYNLPGSSVYGILQARKLEWIAMVSSRGSSWSRNWTQVSYVSCIGRRVL